MKRIVLATCVVFAAALLPATASAHHSWQGGNYTGTAGGGTVTFTVTGFGAIDRVEFDNVQTTCGEYPYTPTSVEIIDHKINEFGFSGSFPGPRQAEGTLVYHRNGTECVSDPVAWSAMSDTTAPQCSDGADNDGDGKHDTINVQSTGPADPGCENETDNDETDPPAAEPQCPGDPSCPKPPDTKPPVLSGLDVFNRRVFYRLSERATVRFTLFRRVGRRWDRFGSFSDAGVAGPNRVKLPRRVGGRRVRPGRYRLFAVPKDAAGNKGARVRRRFRVL